MAKRKIVWTNRAKKRFYGILEQYIAGTKNKPEVKELVRVIDKEIRGLIKHPDLGQKTTKESSLGLMIDRHLVVYQVTTSQIIIKTIT